MGRLVTLYAAKAALEAVREFINVEIECEDTQRQSGDLRSKVVQGIRDTLSTLLPVQGITARLVEIPEYNFTTTEKQDLEQLVDRTVSILLTLDVLLDEQEHDHDCHHT